MARERQLRAAIICALRNWMRDPSLQPAPQLTHRNTKRKMRAVGPLVAADSESNLRTSRIVGASCAASVASTSSSDPTLAHRGKRVTPSPVAVAILGDTHAPPGLRHRRLAPEWA
jgi:hypothetical protein